MHLADQVRAHCRNVAESATLVAIDHSAIPRYAASLHPPASQKPFEADANRPEVEAERRLVLALDTINFGSGWHDVVAKRPGLSGARTMAAALTDFEAASGPLDPPTLRALDGARCCEIFGQDSDNHDAMELMALFARAFSELSEFLDRYGSVEAVVASAERSAVRFAELLTQMPMFADVGYYKRAQITAADLTRRSLANFDDLDQLTAFADNLVPHVLWVDGVITIDGKLQAAIASGELLEPGGTAESELRATAVEAVELMASAVPELTPMGIDQVLWERGGAQRYKVHPRPRCRSFYY